MSLVVLTALATGAASTAVRAEAPLLQVVGTGDGMELMRAVSAAYTSRHPDRVVVVPPSIGSGGGIAAVGAGNAALARVARPLKSAERETGLVEEPLFRLPTAIYVNRSVTIADLTHQQLAAIYRGDIRNWKAVGGSDLAIKVVRREDTDSSLSVLRQSMPGWATLDLTPRSKIAVTTQDAVETVRAVDGAIGFGPYSRKLAEDLAVLSIDGVHPSQDGYPSAVTVSYVWRRDDLPDHARAFVDFGKTREARDLLTALGAIPVSSAKQ